MRPILARSVASALGVATEARRAEAAAGFTALGATRLLSAFEERWNGDA